VSHLRRYVPDGSECKVIALPADLSTAQGCEKLAVEVGEVLVTSEKQLHVLVNNSGTSWGQSFDEFEDKGKRFVHGLQATLQRADHWAWCALPGWDKVLALNLKAAFTLTRAVLPLLWAAASKQDPARVINIGSVAGIRPQPVPTFAYDASKAALHHLTHHLATLLAKKDAQAPVTINVVAPGYFPTKMSQVHSSLLVPEL